MISKAIYFSSVLLLFGWLPIANASPIPNSETVNVNGRYWAQVDNFTNFNWWDIETICPYPNGVCGEGSLNGYELAGWTWASVEDMNSLFNTYIGSNVMSGNAEHRDVGGTWASEFLSDFNFTYGGARDDYQGIAGWTRDTLRDQPPPSFVVYATLVDYYDDPTYWAFADTENTSTGTRHTSLGSWFYIDIPVPATPALLLLAIVALVISRKPCFG